jgi:nicotinate-nucleotide pyrophosphorylase (carboxylating)
MDSPLHDPIGLALAEDIGAGDVTSEYFVNADRSGVARIVARQPAILAGIETAREVFARVDPALRISLLEKSGRELRSGDCVLEVTGSVRSILTAERVALNFLQHLSGVATLTRRFVDAVRATGAQILDTRKTTPGLRALEKAAVVAGGGSNHRFGLFDMALVKDNHLAANNGLDSLRDAIAEFRRHQPQMRIEVEADTLDQVRAFLSITGIDVILLDNMTPATMREAVQLAGGKAKLEASGGVNLETVRKIAETGVDYISVGALTHSAPAIDFSLELSR